MSHFKRAQDLLLTLFSLPLLSACAEFEPANLGELEADRVTLSRSPALAHLGVAAGQADVLAMDLFGESPTSLVQAPDPSQWLQSVAAEHAALAPNPTKLELRVLSYNVGLFSRWYPFTTVQVPAYRSRREHFAKNILGDNWDIVFIQELWENKDFDRLREAAKQNGYLVYGGFRETREKHGMAIAIRESLVDTTAAQEHADVSFEIQRRIETFPGPGIERGYLQWKLRSSTLDRPFELFVTHAQSFPEHAAVRNAQAREYGVAINSAGAGSIVIAGGDLNAGPYYPEDHFGQRDGQSVGDWFQSAAAYAIWIHYSGLTDAFVAAHGDWDVRAMRALPQFSASTWTRAPLGNEALCSDPIFDLFTATDCNSLYFQNYAATEYPARIDHIAFRDDAKRIRVVEAQRVYVAPVTLNPNNAPVELSDHYGMSVTLRVVSAQP